MTADIEGWTYEEIVTVGQNVIIAYGDVRNIGTDAYIWVGLKNIDLEYVSWQEAWLAANELIHFELSLVVPNEPAVELELEAGHRADPQDPIVPDWFGEVIVSLTVCPALSDPTNCVPWLLAGAALGGGLVYLMKR